MFTVCPKCTLTLAVSANDLRVGQGYVRCGRCSNVFNALLKLSEAPPEGMPDAQLPELAQADPASTSQIHRAISAAAMAGSTTHAPKPASPPADTAPTTAAAVPARVAAPAPAPAPSPSTAAAAQAATAAGPRITAVPASASATRAVPARPAAPVPASAGSAPSQAPARPAASAPAASGRNATGTASAATEMKAAAPPVAGTVAPQSSEAAAAPRRRSTDLAGDPRSPPAPSSAAPPGSAPAQATAAPAPESRRSAPPQAAVAASALSRTAAAGTAARLAAAAPVASAPAAAARPGPATQPFAAPASEGSPKESDADAIDQFEMVLQTLGLNADGEEPLLSSSGPGAPPTQTVENIVLEGDEVHQSEARVPGQPLDELDLFTRRLGIATSDPADARASKGAGAAAGQPDTPAGPGAAGVRPAGRLAARRARLAQVARRGTDTANGDGALAAARAAGRDTGNLGTDESDPLEDDAITESAAAPDLDIPGLRAGTPAQQRFWLGGSIVLAALLLLQMLNHWRDALAASPTWGHSVTGLYSALGVPLQPHWDLAAYEVRQQGAESEGGPHSAIRVRFSLANHAMRAQPVPLLRLTLLDRYGRRVAERDLKPVDYWPRGRSAQGFLNADERVDTEVEVRDPSADSASFELDVCLPDAQGGIHCAGDAAAATGSPQ